MQNSVRIISGKFGSRKFKFPAVKDLQPTPDRVRETIFNWLQADIKNSLCLDLFAGSGALGIEALSRGACEVRFVEKNPKACGFLKKNLITLEADSYQIFNLDATKFLEKNTEKFDIILLDPPFKSNLLANSINLIFKHKILKPKSLVIIETPDKRFDVNSQLKILKSTHAGQSHVFLTQPY